MPNHFHGIVFLHSALPVGTARRAPTLERFGNPTTASIPSVIRSFKSAVTKEVNRDSGGGAASVWQRNYYEHVIRSDKALRRICEYIATNPSRWEFDPENPNRKGRDEFDDWLGTFKTRPSANRTLETRFGKADPSAT